MIPTLCLYGMKDESGELFERFNQNNDAFLWAKQTSLDWEPGVCDVFDISNPFSFTSKSLIDRCAEIEEQSITVTKFRKSFYESVACFLDNFKLRHFGVMEKQPIVLINEGCIMILNIAMFMKSQVSTEGMKLTGFSWSPSKSLNSHVYFSAMNPVWTEYESIAHEPNQILKPGLYLCHYVIFVTLEGPSNQNYKKYFSNP